MKNHKNKIEDNVIPFDEAKNYIKNINAIPFDEAKAKNYITNDTFKTLKKLKRNRWANIKNIYVIQDVNMDIIVRPEVNHVRIKECEKTKESFRTIISNEMYVPENYMPPVVRLKYNEKLGKYFLSVVDGNHRVTAHHDVGSTNFGLVILITYKDGLSIDEIQSCDEYVGTYFNQAPETYARNKGKKSEFLGILGKRLHNEKDKNITLEEFLKIATSLNQGGKKLSDGLKCKVEQLYIGKKDKLKAVKTLSVKEREKCVEDFKNKMYNNNLAEHPQQHIHDFYCKEEHDGDYDVRMLNSMVPKFIKQVKNAEKNGEYVTTDVQIAVTTVGNSNFEKINKIRRFKKGGHAICKVLIPYWKLFKAIQDGKHKFLVKYEFTNQIEGDNFDNNVKKYINDVLKNKVGSGVIDVKKLLEEDYNGYGK